MSRQPHDFLPLKPAVHLVLLLLAERARHGYDLLTELETRSNGTIRMNAGSFYRVIRGLSEDGLLERVHLPDDADSGGGARKSYGLTTLGRQVLLAEVARQSDLLELARRWAL